MIAASCPSCGAAMAFASKSLLYAVCRSCRTLVLRRDLDVEKVGVLGQLQDDGTPIQLGTHGRYLDRPFVVVGRVQMEFGDGYWNEWHLDTGRWLGEAQGLYAMLGRVDTARPLPAFADLKPGARWLLEGETFEVAEVHEATCIGGEGELPFEIASGYASPVADFCTEGARFATIDYSEEPPVLFMGEYVEFDALGLTNLRRVEGWP